MTLGFTSPSKGFRLFGLACGPGCDHFKTKIVRERDFQRNLALSGNPGLMLMRNFIADRAGILAICRERGINTMHTEDGFFPHYGTAHGDPLGFCWESALPRQVFSKCSDLARNQAQETRARWLEFAPQELPAAIHPPFVFWPVQLIRDRVNKGDLNVRHWCDLLRDFRARLPESHQLVIKVHPRSKAKDNKGIAELAATLPNTVLVPPKTHLRTLLKECSAVAGANSTVLYEGRLMFHKPAYVYARSWFTNHTELFIPLDFRFGKRVLSRFEMIDNPALLRTKRLYEYTNWFLAQLLGRQIDMGRGQRDQEWFKQRLLRLSYDSYMQHGEEIFEQFD